MNTRAGQFAGVVIGRDVQVMLLSHHFDTAFTILNVDRPFNVRAAVVFQPKINRNCHGITLHCVVKRHHPGMTQRVGPVTGRRLPAAPD